MSWNWELSDWPNFTWDESCLVQLEHQFLLHSGLFQGSFKHLNEESREQLTVESLSSEALTTSEIEGEILDRASLQSSIRNQLGLPTDRRRIPPAEQGIAEVMVSLNRTLNDPLSDQLLFSWHEMLFRNRPEVADVGRYRTHPEPMQVISSKASDSPTVHYEAPPSDAVQTEMKAFVQWFNCTAPSGDRALPALTRAGIAHLYFVSIHPFEDGNGRIGRVVAEKSLGQSVGQPTFIALATTILKKRKGYYAALEATNKTIEISDWLVWFAETALEAQARTAAAIDFLIAKSHFFDRLKGQLNPRQEKALLRVFSEGREGFKGGLSAGNYVRITKSSASTATRDLADLVAKNALTCIGERRHARYFLNLNLKEN